jgi:hypothetical protein
VTEGGGLPLLDGERRAGDLIPQGWSPVRR